MTERPNRCIRAPHLYRSWPDLISRLLSDFVNPGFLSNLSFRLLALAPIKSAHDRSSRSSGLQNLHRLLLSWTSYFGAPSSRSIFTTVALPENAPDDGGLSLPEDLANFWQNGFLRRDPRKGEK